MEHYNLFALQGDTQTTDEDVCSTLGLDPKLAGTPAINDAAIKKIHQQNYEGYLARGVDENTAMSLADEQSASTRSKIKSLSK